MRGVKEASRELLKKAKNYRFQTTIYNKFDPEAFIGNPLDGILIICYMLLVLYDILSHLPTLAK